MAYAPLATLVAFVVNLLLNTLFYKYTWAMHLVPFARPAPLTGVLTAQYLIFAGLLTALYPVGYRGGRVLGEGARFGALMGLVMFVPVSLSIRSAWYVPLDLPFYLACLNAVISSALTGIAVAKVYELTHLRAQLASDEPEALDARTLAAFRKRFGKLIADSELRGWWAGELARTGWAPALAVLLREQELRAGVTGLAKRLGCEALPRVKAERPFAAPGQAIDQARAFAAMHSTLLASLGHLRGVPAALLPVDDRDALGGLTRILAAVGALVPAASSRGARWRHRRTQWLTLGEGTTDVVAQAILIASFFVMGPLLKLPATKRLARRLPALATTAPVRARRRPWPLSRPVRTTA